jgi:hypothetical protein
MLHGLVGDAFAGHLYFGIGVELFCGDFNAFGGNGPEGADAIGNKSQWRFGLLFGGIGVTAAGGESEGGQQEE